MAQRTERWEHLNVRQPERGRGRGGLDRLLPWVLMGFMIVSVFLGFRLMTLGNRIDKAKDLLGDDPNRMATPARLYNILDGTESLVPDPATFAKEKPDEGTPK